MSVNVKMSITKEKTDNRKRSDNLADIMYRLFHIGYTRIIPEIEERKLGK